MADRLARTTVGVAGALVLLAFPAAARSDGKAAIAGRDTAALSAAIGRFLERAAIPGATVAVVRRDGPPWVAGFGRADGSGRRPSPRDRFFLGSTTKTFTALAVLQLVEGGFLDLDTPVERYLPELRTGDARWSRLTVRHLLTHASGLSRLSDFDRRVQWEGRFERIGFAGEPGEGVAYSSLNFLLLGRLIEAVSGLRYAAYMEERVFRPLGMRDTHAERAPAEVAGIVQGHTMLFGWPFPRAEPPYAPAMVPAGYLVSSARDLARYLQLLLREGELEGERLLEAASVAAMLAPQRGGESGVGLGWGIGRRAGGDRVASHDGMTPGFYSVLRVFPDQGLALAVLVNRNGGPFAADPATLADLVEAWATGGPVEPPLPWGRAFHLLIGSLIVLDLLRGLGLTRRWSSLGRPRLLDAGLRVRGRLALDLAVAVVVPVWILYGLAKLPLGAMWEFYPDLAVALVLMAALGTPAAVLRGWVRSSGRRAECDPPAAAPVS